MEEMDDQRRTDWQLAILETFLYCDDVAMDNADAFLLDVGVFNDDLKHIAELVNDVTQTEDRYYSMLNMKVEKNYPTQWLQISKSACTMPFKIVSKYHDHLVGVSKSNKMVGI